MKSPSNASSWLVVQTFLSVMRRGNPRRRDESAAEYGVRSPTRMSVPPIRLLVVCAACLWTMLVCAQTPVTQPEISPAVDNAIAKGLAFLDRQQLENGSFASGDLRCAVTGLALMSYLSLGDTPDVGTYGSTVRRALDYLVASCPANGYYGAADNSRMYGQGIVTLALAEAYGVETDEASRVKLRAALVKAVGVIVAAQNVKKDDNSAGGWRYLPESTDSDLSLSGWNALALRAARSDGIAVPDDSPPRTVQFVLKCWNAPASGFSYQPGGAASPATNAVGMLALYLLKSADRPELAPATKFLVDHPVTPGTRFPYYSFYYTTQAAFHVGEPSWSVVWKATQEQLLKLQETDGGWSASPTAEEPGRIYSTSMALLTLSVPYRLLPAYQR
jgi:hypothetical protein